MSNFYNYLLDRLIKPPHVDFFGQRNLKRFFEKIPMTGSFNLLDIIITNYRLKRRNENVALLSLKRSYKYFRDLLLREDIIKRVQSKTDGEQEFFELTERGRSAKELGGYELYQKHRLSEIKAGASQQQMNKWMLVIAIIALISPSINDAIKDKFFPDKESPNKIIILPSGFSTLKKGDTIIVKPDTLIMTKENNNE